MHNRTHVHAIARMYAYAIARTRTCSIANSTRKRTQMHRNARKLTAVIDAWVISACKCDCVLRVRYKTFRMYYNSTVAGDLVTGPSLLPPYRRVGFKCEHVIIANCDF